ncbi:efflux RND transporter periplasmic adaptor subunit [Bordetella genomosp. 2]
MTPGTSLPPPPRAQRSARALLMAAVAIVLLCGALFAWRAWRTAAPAQAAPPPVVVAAARIQPADAPAALRAVGSLRAVREVRLAPEVAGRVVAIPFEAGTQVRQGDLLVQLYDAPEQADRQAAAARAELARAQYARARALAATGAESREILEQRRAERDQAAAAVAQLDARIAQKQIRAPFAGTLGIRQIDLGQYLSAGDTIANLADLRRLYVDFSVPQQHLPQLRTGGAVQLATDVHPGRVFEARVHAIEPQVDAGTRNIRVQAVLDNPDGALRPGMHVEAALQLPPQRGALIVPATAVQVSPAGDSVLVIRGPDAERAGTAEAVAVTVDRRIGDRVVIAHGLRAGDVVITEGQLRVPPGAAVQVAARQED